MNTHNNVIVVGLLALIAGLLIGHFSSLGMARGGYGMMDRDGDRDRGAQAMGMKGAMGGMMQGLQGKTGDDLDKAFLDGMIVHHEGAVHMAQMLLVGTKRPELIKLGNDIVKAQTAEIAQMQAWQAAWFGK